MNIDAHILCYNEIKFIPFTLAHYSQFCRNITIYDNQSTDGTVEYIKEHYPNVKIETFDTNNQINDAKYLEIKNNCWKGSDADFVIVCDTDEILYHPVLKRLLLTFKQKGITLPMVQGYQMHSYQFPTNTTKPITDQIMTGVRAVHFDKFIIFNPQQVKEINYMPGCHHCAPEGRLTSVRESLAFLYLLHYKYLGRNYLKQKHAEYGKRLSEFNQQNKFGLEYQKGDQHVDECFNLIEKHMTPIKTPNPITVNHWLTINNK